MSIVILLLALSMMGSAIVHAAPSAVQAAESSCPVLDANAMTEYTIPTANSEPWGITAGPDGALWFGEDRNIGRIAVNGTISEYPLQVAHSDQHFLAPGPGGDVWFTDDFQNKIGRITSAGTMTEYAIPTGIQDVDDNGVSFTTSYPRGLVTGADGALWFTENSGNNIGRITTDGQVTEYPIPTADSGPVGLALGSDGAVWFVEKSANQIGRITTDGVITEYPIPTPDSFGLRIAAGPDGALWFSEFKGNNIGRITSDGEITEYALPSAGASPVGITAGFGALWFTEYNGNNIGCITTAGQMTEYAIPTAASVPFSIATGPDGAVWFTENASSKIGRLQVQAAPVPTATPAPAVSLGEHVVAQWAIARPEDIVFGFGSVWVPSSRNPNVTTRIDPVSNEVTAVITGTGYLAKSAVVTGDSVWIAGQRDDLTSIDPTTNTIAARVPGDHPRIAYGFGSIWAVGHQGEPLDRVDPATNTIVASIQLDGTVADRGEENDVLMTASAVWVVDNGELIKIDPATNSIVLRTTFDQVVAEAKAQTTVPAGKGTDFIWLTLDGAGLVRMDSNTGAGLTILPLSPDQMGAPTATDEAVWIAGNGQINRVNVATNQIDATYTIQPGVSRLAIGFGSMWVAYNDLGIVQRLDITP